LKLTWKESGGRPVVKTESLGFGSYLLTKVVPATLRGIGKLEFEPDGLKWVLVVPATSILQSSSNLTMTRMPQPSAQQR
jgi:hypothetical protein